MTIFPVIASFTFLLAQSSSEIIINNNVNNVENNISVKTEGSGNSSVKINNDKFEIEGTVDSVSGSTFTVDTQKITFPQNQENSVSVGNRVRVSGRIKDNILFTENIEVLGSGNSNTKTEIKIDKSELATPSLSPSPAASVTPKSEAAGSADNSGNIIKDILQNILSFLQNIF